MCIVAELVSWCVHTCVCSKEVLGTTELARVGERLVNHWRGSLVLALVEHHSGY